MLSPGETVPAHDSQAENVGTFRLGRTIKAR